MTKLNIAFIHPDLGIGGAEQLVVNLALSLIRQGHSATIYTPYHHKSFPQTHDGTIPVQVHGSFYGLIPRSIFNRFLAVLANIRTLLCTLWLVTYGPQYDAVVCDQVSVVLPLLKLCGYKTIFYCHYPDKLLAGKRGFVKSLYRKPLDLIEEISIKFADLVYVNSQYTRGVFYKNFPRLKQVKTQCLYPAIDFSKFDGATKQSIWDKPYFLSLNRYERKKSIHLAIRAFAGLSESARNSSYLVIAGGHDPRVSENVEHAKQLSSLAVELGVATNVRFMYNISDMDKVSLLTHAVAVLYTPQNQHFGIVPCQAMYCGVPVIASNSGGPMESVSHGKTGFLIDHDTPSTVSKWSEKMELLLKQPERRRGMGIEGKKSMVAKFGLEAFGHHFIEGIESVVGRSRQRKN